MIIYGIVTAVIVLIVGVTIGYGIRAALYGPCCKDELEAMDEIEEMQMRGW